MRNIYALLIFIIITSCKEKCGCEKKDPEAKINDTEVLLIFYSDKPKIDYNNNHYEICNINIIPKNLVDSLHDTSKIKIKVDAELFPFCNEDRRMVGPYIKVTRFLQ